VQAKVKKVWQLVFQPQPPPLLLRLLRLLRLLWRLLLRLQLRLLPSPQQQLFQPSPFELQPPPPLLLLSLFQLFQPLPFQQQQHCHWPQ
jgi:hypothetical protein